MICWKHNTVSVINWRILLTIFRRNITFSPLLSFIGLHVKQTQEHYIFNYSFYNVKTAGYFSNVLYLDFVINQACIANSFSSDTLHRRRIECFSYPSPLPDKRFRLVVTWRYNFVVMNNSKINGLGNYHVPNLLSCCVDATCMWK